MVEATSLERLRVSVMAILALLAMLAPVRLEAQEPLQTTQEPEDTVLVPVGPLQPDIYLAELSVIDGLHYLGSVRNITNRPYSYDNQPMFTPDSRSLLYTTEYGYGDRVQTEIHRYYLSSRRETRITRTDESEYSPTPVPGDRAFSAIRVEADSTQRIWRFTMQGMDGEMLLRNLNAVGYHAWGNETTVLLYVFGEPPTVRIADLTTGQSEVVAGGIGRSLNKIPNRNGLELCREGLSRRGVDQRSQYWDPRSPPTHLDGRRRRVPCLDPGGGAVHGLGQPDLSVGSSGGQGLAPCCGLSGWWYYGQPHGCEPGRIHDRDRGGLHT